MDTKPTVYEKAVEILDKAQSVLLCINNRSSFDTHYAAVAMKRFLESEGKHVTLVANGELILKHKLMFEREGVECSLDLQPQSYVITVDHKDGAIERVSYDDKDGKFRLYITPVAGNKEFNFKNVSYAEGGGSAEVIVVFGCRSLKWMNDIYEQNEDLFDKTQVININNLSGVQEYGTVKLNDEGVSVCELVYDVIGKMGNGKISRQIADMLLQGVIEYLQPFQKSPYKVSSLEKVIELVRAGADVKEAFSKLYFERTYQNFELQRKVMSNFKYEETTGVAWSAVSGIDLAQCGVDRDSFILDGRIAFNMCSDFKIAFVLYEVQEGEIVVELESNSPSIDAKEIFPDYKVAGTSSRIFFTMRDKMLADVEEEVVMAVSRKVGLGGEAGDEDVRIPAQEEMRKEDIREPKVLEEEVVEEDSIAKTNEPDGSSEKIDKKAVKSRKNSVDEVSPATGGLIAPPPLSAEES